MFSSLRGKKTPSIYQNVKLLCKADNFPLCLHWAATSSSKWVRTKHGACPLDDVEDCKACEHTV